VGSKRAGPIDAVVGRTIRVLRLSKGISQGALGRRLGVSFQQVQKYENGTNRVGSGRLFQIAAILGLHVSTFFKGGEGREGGHDSGLLDLLAEPQSVRLIRAFSKITDNTVRRSLVQLAEKFAKSP
jgi:transcriptional regulator with XRE-family HTH domain